jgi:D-aminopeptidase
MPAKPARARDLGLKLTGKTGRYNAITDVPGVAVGMKTIIEDRPRPGRPLPVRTGVTAIMPRSDAKSPQPVWAGISRFNGNGEMTGSHWIADGGYFLGPILITNTHAVGIAHHAAVKWMVQRYAEYTSGQHLWIMPVVAETYDGLLNDINGQPLTEADVIEALDSLGVGPVPEGNSGGGTGMVCYEFKGGTGTASRLVEVDGRSYTVGALVQANHGVRNWLTILGVPVGQHLTEGRFMGGEQGERGSIVVVIATDAPLAPHQLKRLAKRGAIGIGRNGTVGGNSSGDIFLAFSVANPMPMPHQADSHLRLEMLNDERIDPVYEAAVQAIEEAVINAMVAAKDMGGTEWDKVQVKAIDHRALGDVLRQYGRLG